MISADSVQAKASRTPSTVLSELAAGLRARYGAVSVGLVPLAALLIVATMPARLVGGRQAARPRGTDFIYPLY